ncbi:hypothetical protein H4218_000956 [Coemansia sp. IMI 209128]|nr:hypothetical protein H4218_000956 [Coemansia sp. IMI 209128]
MQTGPALALYSVALRGENPTQAVGAAALRAPGFDKYLQAVHRDVNKEDLQTYCTQDNFSNEFVTSAERRYRNMTSGGIEPVFIAANLYNSESVLPNMAAQLLALADTLGHTRLFVSIYENGSRDKTKEILNRFNETLTALGIPHRVIADDRPKPKHTHRIEYLAALRNLALEPLYSSNAAYGRVVYLNDMFFCLTDLLELVFQSQAHRAHLTCAEDFELKHGSLTFYDTWVARDILGHAFKKQPFNIADDGAAKVAQMKSRPFQVQSNLHNNEKVLPNMAAQLLELADTLGHSRIFISIYENGSTDRTKEILHRFNETLNALGIAHKIVTDKTPKPKHIHRIEYLAKLRNYAMEPLYSDGARFGRVAFLNDVYFCHADLLELLFQSQTHGAHLTCGEDYDIWQGEIGFYDTWVARNIQGEQLDREVQILSSNDTTMSAEMWGRPFQVQCCWNGMAVIDAKVFRGDDGLRFRRSAKDECSASECSLFCNDLWRKGFSRVIMVPRVKLSYDIPSRNMLRKPLYSPADLPYNNPEIEKISFRPGPEKVHCMPLNGINAIDPDGPDTYVALL